LVAAGAPDAVEALDPDEDDEPVDAEPVDEDSVGADSVEEEPVGAEPLVDDPLAAPDAAVEPAAEAAVPVEPVVGVDDVVAALLAVAAVPVDVDVAAVLLAAVCPPVAASPAAAAVAPAARTAVNLVRLRARRSPASRLWIRPSCRSLIRPSRLVALGVWPQETSTVLGEPASFLRASCDQRGRGRAPVGVG